MKNSSKCLRLPDDVGASCHNPGLRIAMQSESMIAAMVRCPSCGGELEQLPLNHAVADLRCTTDGCEETFQVKSILTGRSLFIVGGDYVTTITAAITGTHANVAVLTHDGLGAVTGLWVAPRGAIGLSCIRPRPNRLGAHCHRPGTWLSYWDLRLVPERARVQIIRRGIQRPHQLIAREWERIATDYPVVIDENMARTANAIFRFVQRGDLFTVANVRAYLRVDDFLHRRRGWDEQSIRRAIRKLTELGVIDVVGPSLYRLAPTRHQTHRGYAGRMAKMAA
jgi:hypothetical protein